MEMNLDVSRCSYILGDLRKRGPKEEERRLNGKGNGDA
jgi:hypothetical protein